MVDLHKVPLGSSSTMRHFFAPLDSKSGVVCVQRFGHNTGQPIQYRSHNHVGRFINYCKKRRPPLKTINFIIDALDPYLKIINNVTKEPL